MSNISCHKKVRTFAIIIAEHYPRHCCRFFHRTLGGLVNLGQISKWFKCELTTLNKAEATASIIVLRAIKYLCKLLTINNFPDQVHWIGDQFWPNALAIASPGAPLSFLHPTCPPHSSQLLVTSLWRWVLYL